MAYIGGRSESEIWIMGADGENPRKLLQGAPGDRFLQLQWSPDGQRVAVLNSHTQGDESKEIIEAVPLTGGNASTILSLPGLRSFCWSADGRVIYSLNETPSDDKDTNLWEVRVDPTGAKTSADPQRITTWAGLSLSDLSVSADGTHLAFVNAGFQTDIYVATLGTKDSLGAPRRFTLMGRNNIPSAWTQDGRALIFSSDRNGSWNIFWQGLQERSAQDFLWGPGEQTEPRLSPDASLVLYWDYVEKAGKTSAPMRLLRVPISGGAPELVVEASRGATVRCAHAHSTCVLAEVDRAKNELVFTALDPRQGRKGELIRLATDLAGTPDWDLSPDGSTLAIVNLDQPKDNIRVVGLENKSSRQIALGRSERLSGIAWSADGRGWFVTSSSLLGAKLFFVPLNGQATELWTSPATLGEPLSSPDGKNLAFTVSSYNSNAWLIQNF